MSTEVEVFHIATVSELISTVATLSERTRSRLWYRGQRDQQWDVEPSVFRKDHLGQERNYVHRFRSRAGIRYAHAPRYCDFALWLALMQHYRLPTRLLDWTRSPLIAAYFAVESFLYEQPVATADAVIWVLQAHDLNIGECGESVTPSIEAKMVAPLLDPAFLDKEEETNKVLAVMASEHDLRMFVQQGCFTVHSDRKPLNHRSSCANYLKKLIIRAQAIPAFAREIEICGFRRGDIYPDLEHLADELRAKKGA